MAMKKKMSVKLTEEDIALVERLASTTGLPKSTVIELVLDIVKTYFTEDQLRTEASMFQPADGRRNGD